MKECFYPIIMHIVDTVDCLSDVNINPYATLVTTPGAFLHL